MGARWCLTLGSLVFAVALSGCASPAARSMASQGPHGDSEEGVHACADLSLVWTQGERTGLFRTSALSVPVPLRSEGFGVADAECLADPSSGVYYAGLVWKRAVADSALRRFVDHLHRLGFIDGSTTAPDVIALDAPRGVMTLVDGRTQQMQHVYIESSVKDSLTFVVWI